MSIQKVLKSNPNSTVTLTPNLTESFSTLRFFFWDTSVVNIVRDRLCETFSIFYHGLHVWYHEILTNLIIFKLCLLLLEFKSRTATCLWSCFLNKMFEISFHSLGKASHWTQKHEYHFLNYFILLFVSLAVQIWLVPKNFLKSNKLIKYSKQIQKYTKS